MTPSPVEPNQEFIGLVDANCFYVRCERSFDFDPTLRNLPVLVFCVRLGNDHMLIRNRFLSARW